MEHRREPALYLVFFYELVWHGWAVYMGQLEAEREVEFLLLHQLVLHHRVKSKGLKSLTNCISGDCT